MNIIPISRTTVKSTRADFKARVGALPAHAKQLAAFDKQLVAFNGPGHLLKHASFLVFHERKFDVFIARFDMQDSEFTVCSASGMLAIGDNSFPGQNPGGVLMKVLSERKSFHLPEVDVSRYADSIPYEMHWDGGSSKATMGSFELFKTTPKNMQCRFRGAALITPLGLEMSTGLAPGIIYEHKPSGPFFAHEIALARAFSSALMKNLAILSR